MPMAANWPRAAAWWRRSSEHTLVGMLEGYLLTGRYGLFHTYEAFAHVIASMFNQHAKWLESCRPPRPLAGARSAPGTA
jgi:phosphoketolase